MDEELARENLDGVVASAPRSWEPALSGEDLSLLLARALEPIDTLAALKSLPLTDATASWAVSAVRAAAADPDDPETLLVAARSLDDLELTELSIPVLGHALEIAPGNGEILCSLTFALNIESTSEAICHLLTAHLTTALTWDYACESLAGVATDTGNFPLARTALEHLPGNPFSATARPPQRHWARRASLGDSGSVARAARRVQRHDALAAPDGPPGEGDSRAWELITNGDLLLRQEPDPGTRAREGKGSSADVNHSYRKDTYSAINQVVALLEVVLSAAGRRVDRVAFAADRDSEILAWGIGTCLRRPVIPADTAPEPYDLVVGYHWERGLRLPGVRRATHSSDRTATFFGYRVSFDRDPPDIIGMFGRAAAPWAERHRHVQAAQRATSAPPELWRDLVLGRLDHGVEVLPADERPAWVIGRELAALPREHADPDRAEVLDLLGRIIGGDAPFGLTGEREKVRFRPPFS